MLETIGFVLLVSTCGNDACEALPVTDDLYTQQECEVRLKYIAKRRPKLYFMCNEVLRETDGDSGDEGEREENHAPPAPRS